MNISRIVLHEPDYSRIRATLSKLLSDTTAWLALLIDRSGHPIASAGDPADVDLTALASLSAANASATDCLAKLIGEPEFTVVYHQGSRQSICIADISRCFLLVVILAGSVPIGMVRLKIIRAGSVIEEIFHAYARRASDKTEAAGTAAESAAPKFTDDEIEKLVRQLKPGN